MDDGLSRAVREAFVRLYEEGLIYRDDYIVNWCPRCQTVLSDLEVEREERDAEFVYIKYGPLTLGTVRPETKLGDTGLAVHPDDARYAQYVGQTLRHPVGRRRRSPSRSSPTRPSIPSSAPASSRSRPATTRSTSRSAGATTCPCAPSSASTAR